MDVMAVHRNSMSRIYAWIPNDCFVKEYGCYQHQQKKKKSVSFQVWLESEWERLLSDSMSKKLKI
jgi:hypothetical protein